jgi:hypothetical protein
VFAVAVFLAVVVTGGGERDCAPSGETGTLAVLSLLPRLMGFVGRGLWLLSAPDKANESECPASR